MTPHCKSRKSFCIAVILSMSRQTVSIFCELPGGRPSRIPLSFFTAKASFVLCDIRVLSISAARAKAKAMIFELIFSERSKLFFMEWIDMPLSAQRLRIDIIISIFLPRREISVQMSMSPFRMSRMALPSSRFSIAIVPETVSETHLSIVIFCRSQYFLISNS